MTNPSLPDLFRALTEPGRAIREADRRRARLLAWLHLALLLLTVVGLVVVFVFHATDGALGLRYGALIVSLMLVLLAAYGLNRAGRYTPAAWLTVLVGVVGPWASAWLDNTLLSSDVVGLVYAVIPIFLASLLLSAPATAALAVFQIATLTLLPFVSGASLAGEWPSLVTFVLFLSVLCVVAAVILRQDMAQIEHQARQLAASEAQLREQSVRDGLTGLFNWRYLEETLARELRRAARGGYAIGVIMIDIDHFKHFNDSYGHALGDEVLRQLGALLNAQVRGSDIACRYGGEEFILLLPEATALVTRERAEAIRASASGLRVRHEGQPVEPITLSIGLALFPSDGETPAALLKSVDDALYQAKRAGRDRVAVAG